MNCKTFHLRLLTCSVGSGILPIMVKVPVLSSPLVSPVRLDSHTSTHIHKLFIYIYIDIHIYVCVCVCVHACVPEWVSLLLPLSDGFGLNNVIIKVFPELLPCLPPVTPLPAINQLPESCKSHGVSVCLSKCVCVSA